MHVYSNTVVTKIEDRFRKFTRSTVCRGFGIISRTTTLHPSQLSTSIVGNLSRKRSNPIQVSAAVAHKSQNFSNICFDKARIILTPPLLALSSRFSRDNERLLHRTGSPHSISCGIPERCRLSFEAEHQNME